MKLVLATPLYPPEAGGPATYAKILEEELPKHGIEVVTVKFGEVRHLPPLIRHVAYFFAVLKETKGAKVILVQDTVSAGLPSTLASIVSGVPLIVRVPGDYAWEQSTQRYGVTDSIDEFQHKKYGSKVETLRNIQRFVVSHAKKVIVPSKYFGQIVEGWGVCKENVVVIYHGVVPLLFDPVSVSKNEKLLAISVGRLVPWKGFAEIVRAFESLPNWHLVIIGDGPEKERLQRVIQEKQLSERVILLGGVSRPTVLSWCKVADAFVLNTAFESFSFQVAEAMALGTPVIATSVGSLPELIESGKEGVLLTLNDVYGFQKALEEVDTKKEIWNSRVRSAREKIQGFSKDTMILKTAQLIQHI